MSNNCIKERTSPSLNPLFPLNSLMIGLIDTIKNIIEKKLLATKTFKKAIFRSSNSKKVKPSKVCKKKSGLEYTFDFEHWVLEIFRLHYKIFSKLGANSEFCLDKKQPSPTQFFCIQIFESFWSSKFQFKNSFDWAVRSKSNQRSQFLRAFQTTDVIHGLQCYNSWIENKSQRLPKNFKQFKSKWQIKGA